MPRQVKGPLFAEYVRTLRSVKQVDWTKYLQEEDLPYLTQAIDYARWYPMDTYERMGLAIFDVLGQGNLNAVRQFGRHTIETLYEAEPDLFEGRDPREIFMRFQVLRQAMFDFKAAEVVAIRDGRAVLEVGYGMSPRAEEAASWQSVGFLERLMELSGAKEVEVTLASCSWKGDESTRLNVTWK
jgi:hypothetical protein